MNGFFLLSLPYSSKIFIQMKSFIAKWVNSILVNLRYLRFKLLKYKENDKKICNTVDHNFKNIPLYIMRKVSLERYYFVWYDYALTLKMSNMALNLFCDKTLQMSMVHVHPAGSLHCHINRYVFLFILFWPGDGLVIHPFEQGKILHVLEKWLLLLFFQNSSIVGF